MRQTMLSSKRITEVEIAGTRVPRVGLGTNRLARTPENVAFIREAVAAGMGMIDDVGEAFQEEGPFLGVTPLNLPVAGPVVPGSLADAIGIINYGIDFRDT